MLSPNHGPAAAANIRKVFERYVYGCAPFFSRAASSSASGVVVKHASTFEWVPRRMPRTRDAVCVCASMCGTHVKKAV